MLKNVPPSQRRAYVREGLLLVGFVLLIIAGIATVVIPELSKTPEDTGRPTPAKPSK
jgi:TRAP-type mannitol/chloroaromatic compound transport system permease small subunit